MLKASPLMQGEGKGLSSVTFAPVMLLRKSSVVAPVLQIAPWL